MSYRYLLVEAGGTSTSWAYLGHTKKSKYKTRGFNVTRDGHGHLKQLIKELPINNVEHIFFYVAGLKCEEQTCRIKTILKNIFPEADKITVNSDVLGAARGVFNSGFGYLGILGTGSGLHYYDGRSVTSVVPSLGYLLGDEGSGAYIGKQLLKKYYRGEFSKENQKLLDTIVPRGYLRSLYQKPSSSDYAIAAKWLAVYKSNHEFKQLIIEAFHEYFKVFGTPKIKRMSFIGSIAFHFQEELYQVAQSHEIICADIVQDPLDLLIKYHDNQLK